MEKQIILTHLEPKEYAFFFEKGISYDAYMTNMTEEVENKVEKLYAQYVPMNLQRSKRVGKTTHLQTEVLSFLTNLNHKIKWLVISEHWCGDASQIVPILATIAAASEGMIDMRIVYRDENPTLIEAHLTNGGKSIPKLIQLDADFKVIGEWGPRPAAAQQLVMELKSNPLTASTYADSLHKWYADDKSISTQEEILAFLKAHS